MTYIVSARKYRPAQFRDVVGQKHVTTTLKNAINNGKLAQSFLFCGPRGVGKTTCARILAKTLNCQNLQENIEPCGTCQACQSFEQSASFNIFELDAASNNSVEDIRSLIEQVRFAPQSGKYKIYIIDEVHMLSQAAFNAFLKTLEEPPSYAVFILATTEKHKIIPTILSRCQTFDFTRIQVNHIVEHLQYIAKDQGIEVELDALHLIAQKADGGLRDALSIYDRISSFATGTITYAQVVDSLNILDYDYFFKVTEALLLQDTSTTLLTFNHILQKGFEGDNFIVGLAEHFRNLLVCKDEQTLQLLEVSEGVKNRYRQQSTLSSASFLLSCLNVANECSIQYRMSKNKRLQVELALLKMAFVNQSIDLSKQPLQAPLQKKNSVAQQPSIVASPTVTYQKNVASASPKNQTVVSTTTSPQNQPTASNTVSTNPQTQTVAANTTTPNPQNQTTAAKTITPTIPKSKINFFVKAKSKTGGLNISSLDKIKAQEKAKIAEAKKKAAQGIQQKELTEVEVQTLWSDYSKTLESPGTKALFQRLKPSFSDAKHHLKITVGSKLQEAQVNEEKPTFLNILAKETGGIRYQMHIKIDRETQVEVEKPLSMASPKDRLQAMYETNPILGKLVKKLSLELKY
ncbi:MAG: DNA polymerase III subunit gamma/tau [Chitinophagales bacterium]